MLPDKTPCCRVNAVEQDTIIKGNGDTTGVALVEIYDLNQEVDSKLANLSTRAFVSTGDDIVIAGFVVSDDIGSDRVVVRGIGPSLAAGGPGIAIGPTRVGTGEPVPTVTLPAAAEAATRFRW